MTAHAKGKWSIKTETEEYFDGSKSDIKMLVHEDRGIIMSDSEFELDDQEEFLSSNPGGHIVIGGLGLGIIVDRLLKRSDVLFIEAIEIDRDIIDLMGEKFVGNNRVSVIQGDVRDFAFSKLERTPDYVFLDIWDGDAGDSYEERISTKQYWEQICSNVFVWALDRSSDRYKES